MCWKLNPASPQEQQEFLTGKPSLQSLNRFFFLFIILFCFLKFCLSKFTLVHTGNHSETTMGIMPLSLTELGAAEEIEGITEFKWGLTGRGGLVQHYNLCLACVRP